MIHLKFNGNSPLELAIGIFYIYSEKHAFTHFLPETQSQLFHLMLNATEMKYLIGKQKMLGIRVKRKSVPFISMQIIRYFANWTSKSIFIDCLSFPYAYTQYWNPIYSKVNQYLTLISEFEPKINSKHIFLSSNDNDNDSEFNSLYGKWQNQTQKRNCCYEWQKQSGSIKLAMIGQIFTF